MNDIRARFEEIWPVPEGVVWDGLYGGYWYLIADHESARSHDELNLRLDTFTRCQEIQSEMERALAGMLFAFDDGVGREWSEDLLDCARKLVAAKEYVK